MFSVENTGTHIPEDDIPKLFDAFYRMEQSRSRRTGGSGLGLYMVQIILQQHNSYCGLATQKTVLNSSSRFSGQSAAGEQPAAF